MTLQIANLASVPGFNATSCPGGAAPMPSAVPLSSAFINVTVLYSFSGNATIPYGNGTANATAGSVKWNLDAQGWWVCVRSLLLAPVHQPGASCIHGACTHTHIR